MKDNKKNSFFGKSTLLHLHPYVRPVAAVILLNLLIFSAFRIAFLLFYLDLFADVPLGRMFLAFLHGLRFDLSVTFLLFGLPFLAAFLPGRWPLSRWFRASFRTAVYLLFMVESGILAADLVYFSYVHRHLGAEAFTVIRDIPAMASLSLALYGGFFLVFAGWAAACWIGWGKVFRRTLGAGKAEDLPPAFSRPGIVGAAVHVCALLAVGTLAVRGGLQSKPLRVSHAFLWDDVMPGHLSLNGVFTMAQAVRKGTIRFDISLPYPDAVKVTRELLREPDTVFIDDRYPLLRRHLPSGSPGGRPNVVVVILESWSADAVGATGGGYGATPCFDSLARKGLLFTNFYAVGQRSIDAVTSILCSFPSFSGCRIVGKAYEQDSMTGLGSVLKRAGYRTLFFCGARRDSMGFDVFAYKAGFDRYVSREDFAELPARCFDGTWGVFDEYVFERAHEVFSSAKGPFLGVIYTLNPHGPYTVPSEKFKKYGGTKHAAYLNALYYSDWTVGRFFSLARTSSYFRNTLFILVADHAEGHHERTVRDRFRIPCLFLFPGRIAPGKDDRVGSHLDILPSIVDLLDLDALYASAGVSLFGSARRTALVSWGNVFGLFAGEHLLLHSLERPLGLYLYRADPEARRNIASSRPALVSRYERELLALLKVVNVTLDTNTIAPLRLPPARAASTRPLP